MKVAGCFHDRIWADILERWFSNGRLLGNDSGWGEPAQSLLQPPMTKMIDSGEIYIGDGLEIKDCSAMTIGGETVQSLLWSPMAEVCGFVEIYLGDDLEIAGWCAIALGERLQPMLIHFMVLKCISLCAAWQRTCATRSILIIWLGNGLEWKKIINVSYCGLER